MRKYPIKPWKDRSSIEKILSHIKYLKLIVDTIKWTVLKLRGKATLPLRHWNQIGLREIRFQLGMNNHAMEKAAAKKS